MAKKTLVGLLMTAVAAGFMACSQPQTKLSISGTTELAEYAVGDEIRLANEEYAGSVAENAIGEGGSVETAMPKEINLKNRTIVPHERIDPLLVERIEKASTEKVHAILQYDNNLTKEDRAYLKDNWGIEILNPLQTGTYIASVPADTEYIDATSNVGGLKLNHAAEILPEDKIDRNILNKVEAPWAKVGGKQGFMVKMHGDSDMDALKERLENLGATVGDYDDTLNIISVSVDEPSSEFFVAMAGELDDVSRVAYPPPPLTPDNNNMREVSNVDFMQEQFPYLDGEGVLLAVYDGGYADHDHSDLDGRVNFLGEVRFCTGEHATHVMCTAGGTGKKSYITIKYMCERTFDWPDLVPICDMWDETPEDEREEVFSNLFRGIAPAAEFYSEDYGNCRGNCLYNNPKNISGHSRQFAKKGVVAVNNSISANVAKNGYPCDWEGDYEDTCRLYDGIVYGEVEGEKRERSLIEVLSAGNENDTDNCNMEGDNVGYHKINTPGSSKNTIKVGAVGITDRGWVKTASYTSFGPLDDGRTGVTVMDYGGDKQRLVISCALGSRDIDYMSMAGTSMAAPAVLGKVALLTQLYREISGGFDPRPELVKAVLANTAIDLEEPFVDYKTGFGMVDMWEAYKTMADERFHTATMHQTGDHDTIVMMVENADMPIQVMLAYTDYPGEPMAEKALVNNLDIWLESPSGVIYQPFILDPANPHFGARRGVDNINNIEQVVVGKLDPDVVEIGNWKIHVSGTDIVMGEAPYAVAASHPTFNADPAKITNYGGTNVSGYLQARLTHEECYTPEECYRVTDRWLLDDFATDTKRVLKKGNKLKVYELVPPIIAESPGDYCIEFSFRKKNGGAIKDDRGNVMINNACYTVMDPE